MNIFYPDRLKRNFTDRYGMVIPIIIFIGRKICCFIRSRICCQMYLSFRLTFLQNTTQLIFLFC